MNDTEMINALHQHMNTLTNRLINAEMALDVTLGMLFNEKESFKDEFTEKFDARIKEVNVTREVAINKAKAEQEAHATEQTEVKSTATEEV